MNQLKHLTQSSLFGFTAEEQSGISKAVDSLRGMDTQPLSSTEQVGVTRAVERIQHKRKRRNGLGFPRHAEKGNGLLDTADEISSLRRRELK